MIQGQRRGVAEAETFKSAQSAQENKRGNRSRFPLFSFRRRKPSVAQIDGQVGAEAQADDTAGHFDAQKERRFT